LTAVEIWRDMGKGEEWKGLMGPNEMRLMVVLGYEAGHLLRGQRTLETKKVTRRGLFLAS
jgi:hypothetical protein